MTLLNTSTARKKKIHNLLGHVLLRLCSRTETMVIQKYFSVNFTSRELNKSRRRTASSTIRHFKATLFSDKLAFRLGALVTQKVIKNLTKVERN